MNSTSLHRRHFLRSSTAVVALPLLESLGFRRFAHAAPATAPRPKRMVFLGMGFGVTKETWYPDNGQTGANWQLSEGLKPLARHQQDITLIQNLSNRFTDEAHWGSTFWLTGANRYGEPGQSFHNSVSADQAAAEVLGKDTRFTSLQLCAEDASSSGHGPGLSLAWSRQGKPISGFDNPVIAYHRLFSEENVPLAQRQVELANKRSVLDAVMSDARSVSRGLSHEDTGKLQEYLQSIRDIETRLSKEEQWLDVPKPKPGKWFKEPREGIAGHEEMKVMYDLIVAALQTDASRVITYRQPLESVYQSLDVGLSAHNCSHYQPGARMDASQLRDRKQSELFAHFIDRLKATPEPDGTTLFDHTCVTLGSNIQSVHYLDNCPTIITGRGAALKLGQHIILPEPKTPLCNLWLTQLQGMGIAVENHGDSTGTLRELVR